MSPQKGIVTAVAWLGLVAWLATPLLIVAWGYGYAWAGPYSVGCLTVALGSWIIIRREER